MVRLRFFILFCIVCISERTFGRERKTRAEWVPFKEVSQDGRDERDAFRHCPPPPGEGTLQLSASEFEAYRSSVSGGPLSSLSFMCGQTMITEKKSLGKIPILEDSGEMTMVESFDVKEHYIPLCCPGYIRNESNICVPKCKGGCSDGVCVKPRKCACFEGYVENELGQCVLKCPCSCPHGKCEGNSCVCSKGYKLNTTSQTCNPICELECVNGDCTAPNTCTCHYGYKARLSESHICVPKCEGCFHGTCIAPYVCRCNEGYEWNSENQKCKPKCFNCEHGKCMKPWTCVCDEGYKLQNQTCIPICKTPCINGTCIKPNKCGCNRGYIPVSKNVCVYGCNPDCQNGDCVGLNECECHEGYTKKSKAETYICYNRLIVIQEISRDLVENVNGWKHRQKLEY